MSTRKKLRLIALAMFAAAVAFVFCALCCPTLGRTIYIGGFAFGAKQKRVCYAIYAGVMLGLFVASFFVRNPAPKEEKHNEEV